ncbi:uncharacterized protein [Spinacia oleracea]|uniref:Reverse transcriptase domain-containing protein n=1 Tax=Spinacia oleracea TaxID=3562 RepID=A0ABM3R6V5_SPIOL|nr:uncharacterized protein LOC130466762 [Spinacia oleracea]
MRNCMLHCKLTEVKTVGRLYTWNNKQDGEDRVFSRIDRVLANSEWNDLFDTAEANFMPEGHYDHSPMLLNCYQRAPQKRPFRFFNMWTTSPRFNTIVEENWKKYVYGCPMYRVMQKLKWIKMDLKVLNQEGYNNVEAEQIKRHKALLEVQNLLHSTPGDQGLASREKVASDEYRRARENYLSFLQQTAKVQWLQNGDDNTKAFHQSIRQRRKQNRIYAIHNGEGKWVQTDTEVQMAFVQFYKNLFCTTMENKAPLLDAVMDMGPRLNDTHRGRLACSVTVEDIKRVLDTIPSSKAPGMDGFNSHFFRTTWDTIKGDIHSAIKDFFETGKILKEVNITSITLVPKVKVTSSVGDFRPIACCSVIYKCISKLMCEKLN